MYELLTKRIVRTEHQEFIRGEPRQFPKIATFYGSTSFFGILLERRAWRGREEKVLQERDKIYKAIWQT